MTDAGRAALAAAIAAEEALAAVPDDPAGDAALAAALNDPDGGTPMPRPVPYAEFALAMAGLGLRAKLRAGAATADPPAGLCETILELLRSPHIREFDPANGLPLMAALADLGVLNQTDVATITAFVTRPASRAENALGAGTRVTPGDVSLARRGG